MSDTFKQIYEKMVYLSAIPKEELDEVQQAELKTLLEELSHQAEEKIDNYGKFSRYSKAQEQFLDEEIKLLQAKKKAVIAARDRANAHYLWVMSQNGIMQAEGKHTKISLCPNIKVDVTVPAEMLPEQYQRVKTEIEADKNLLKVALQNGEEINGVSLVDNVSLQIK